MRFLRKYKLSQRSCIPATLETWRPNEILVDICPAYAGGDDPWTGTIRLSNFTGTTTFIAQTKTSD